MMKKEAHTRPVGRPAKPQIDEGLPVCSDHAQDAMGMMWIRLLPEEKADAQ